MENHENRNRGRHENRNRRRRKNRNRRRRETRNQTDAHKRMNEIEVEYVKLIEYSKKFIENEELEQNEINQLRDISDACGLKYFEWRRGFDDNDPILHFPNLYDFCRNLLAAACGCNECRDCWIANTQLRNNNLPETIDESYTILDEWETAMTSKMILYLWNFAREVPMEKFREQHSREQFDPNQFFDVTPEEYASVKQENEAMENYIKFQRLQDSVHWRQVKLNTKTHNAYYCHIGNELRKLINQLKYIFHMDLCERDRIDLQQFIFQIDEDINSLILERKTYF
jgi:hypothetical protein